MVSLPTETDPPSPALQPSPAQLTKSKYVQATETLIATEAKQLPYSKHVYPAGIPISDQIHTDQTGHFTITASSENKYLSVLFNYDVKFIHAIPIPSRSKL